MMRKNRSRRLGTLSTAAVLAFAIHAAHAGDQTRGGGNRACPPGTAPQTVTHEVGGRLGPAAANYRYSRQSCEPIHPPTSQPQQARQIPAPRVAPQPQPLPHR